MAFKWKANLALHLVRLVKRSVDEILGAAPPNAWNYVHTSLNTADVATVDACKNSE